VVMLEYPRQGVWSIGFVTGIVAPSVQAHINQPVLSVFIPTTPNPTSGWYTIIPESEVITVDISIEDAFKILISGGIVSPDYSPTPTKPLTSVSSSVILETTAEKES